MRKAIITTAVIAFIAGGLSFTLLPKEKLATLFESQEVYTKETAQSLVAETGQTVSLTDASTASTQTNSVAETQPQITQTDTAETDTATNATASATELNATRSSAGQEEQASSQATVDQEKKLEEYREAIDMSQIVKEKEKKLQENLALDVPTAMQDHAIGSVDAPVTIYDYSSLTCPHCANFHNTILPKVKQYYIDTGKVRWVFRTFPHNEPALRAEMLARCMPRDQYVKMIDLMFANQQRWAFAPTPLPNLQMLVKVAGVDSEKFEACTTNKQLEAAVLKIAQDASEKYDVVSTPTFVFADSGKKLEGAGTYEGFAYELDNYLEKVDTRKNASQLSTPIPEGKL